MGGLNSGGRTALTPEEHRARGSFDKRRHEGFQGVEAVEGAPQPPDDLQGESLKEWHRMVWRLEKCKILSMTDDSMIYQYAKLYGEIRAAEIDAEAARVLSRRLEKASEKLEGMDLVYAIRAIVDMK